MFRQVLTRFGAPAMVAVIFRIDPGQTQTLGATNAG